MADKFKNTFRIPSTRWQDWDYGANSAYFVTVCTAHWKRLFGEIVDDEMTLSEIGRMAHNYWLQIPAHFPFTVLDAFVIMPNHVHGIIVIDADAAVETPYLGVSTMLPPPAPAVQTPNLGVSTMLPTTPTMAMNIETKRWYSGTLGVIINQYKRACTMYARKNGIPFAWQARFHDHVIRNDSEHHRVAQYINANIENWQNDELYG
jgi:hypothetical protein